MFYDIGSVSNRNIQLLYEYRILREPSENLTAICRDSTPQETSALNWRESRREIEGVDKVYETELSGIQLVPDCVPFLEFHPESDTEWKWIADFIDLEVTASKVILYSTTDPLNQLPISVYWCYSLRHIDSMLNDILDDLKQLSTEYDQLEYEIKNFRDTGSYLKRPKGLVPNLVKIQHQDEGADLVDSLYMIMTAESNRLFVNYSQDNLNTMEHIFNETVEFRFLNKDHYVLDSIIAPTMLISGSGDLVVKNLKGQVLVTKWKGTITVIDCPEVHLSATNQSNACTLTKMQISKGSTVYLENYIHHIEELSLFADSLCRHWRANIKKLSYVGPGCTYWCCAQVDVPGRIQRPEYKDYTDNINTVYDFQLHDILGMFLSDFDDMMIVGQKNLTTRLGNCDAEPIPYMYVPKWTASYMSTGGNGGNPGGNPGGPGSVPGGDSDKAPGWYPNTDETNYSSTGIHGWYSKGVGEALYTVYSQSAGEWENGGHTFWGGSYSGNACGPTSVATIATGYGKNVTPLDAGEGIKQQIQSEYGGSYDSGLWACVRDELTRLGVPATGVSASSSSLQSTLPQSQFKSKVISLLTRGTPVIVNVGKCGTYGPRGTSSGHFFTLLDYNSTDDTAFIGDPAGYMGNCCGFYSLDTILSPAQAIFWPTS